MNRPTSQFSSVLHILAEHAEWDQLASRLQQLLILSTEDEQNQELMQKHLRSGEGAHSWTPLMLSCARAPPHVIELLLKCSKESANIPDRSGMFPLHFVCSYWNNEHASDTGSAYPVGTDSSIDRNNEEGGDHAINQISYESDLHKILKMLIRSNPRILTNQNQWGQTPLHSIFDRDDLPGVETIKILLGLSRIEDRKEEIEKNQYDNDNESQEDDDKQDNLIKSYAISALAKPDSNSFLPLHLAASKGASEEILRIMVSLYSDAATVTTANGDLPIHLLQYWTEDEAKHSIYSDSGSGEKMQRLVENGIFRPSKKIFFSCVSVRQIEALLEPICLESSSASFSMDPGSIFPISERNEFDKRTSVSIAGMNLASRLPGSRNVNLPIHIAAEHGVSLKVLSALCEQYPEGVSTPQPADKSVYGSSSSVISSTDGSVKRRSQEMYPIEIFETGRAGIIAAKFTHMQRRHVNNPNNNAVTNSTFVSSAIDMNEISAILKSFEERSDLLFAYYPDAMPCKYREEKDERRQQTVAKLERVGSVRLPAREKKRSIDLYRNDIHRLRRLERLIRSESLQPILHEFNMTAQRVWLWMYEGINSSVEKMRGNHQGSIGRIITNLPQAALLKLSYYVHVSKNLKGSTQEDLKSLRYVPCMIQGRSILDIAKDRAPKISMEEMLSSKSNPTNNWQSVVCSFLDAQDGLQYNAICLKTRDQGLQYLAENNLDETGRTWNVQPFEGNEILNNSEFWQHLDPYFFLQECTHTVILKYYVEVSEIASSNLGETINSSLSDCAGGGLIIVSERNVNLNRRLESTREQIEAMVQKTVVNPKFKTISGREVCLSFRYKPGFSYSLRAYGPCRGGRISVSGVRIQQVVHSIDRYNRTPLHILLSRKSNSSQIPMSTQVSMILEKDASNSVPLHLALKYGASVEVLNALIEANPSSLLTKDEQGCTPLHYVFLISDEIIPTLSVVRTLLTTPGENAARIKDSVDRLPLHIAAQIGANDAILELLLDANADGCYRKNRDGDLPIHLLVRSDKATASSVEILLAPIIDSETICGIPGSQGLNLPLHIAAEYNCSYKILEGLLLSYGEAASIPRRISRADGQSMPPLFALDIFEANRKSTIDPVRRNESQRTLQSTSLISYGEQSINSETTQEAVRSDMETADFDLRSDLIFVFYPVVPAMGSESKAYRRDNNRISRLESLIRREAINCSEYRKVNHESSMSEMTQLAWSFFCTFENPKDPSDEYSKSVGNILKGLPNSVVQLLADVRNPFSTPITHMVVTACATAKCKRLITSRLLFVGRFVLDHSNVALHESYDSLIIAAKDHGMEEAYRRFIMTFKKEEDITDIDDLASHHSGTIGQMSSFGEDAQSMFVDFALKLGIDEDSANTEYERLVLGVYGNDMDTSDYLNHSNHSKEKYERKEITLDMFRKFCDYHRVDSSGVRDVVIKFMKHRIQFLREKVVRARLNSSKAKWCILPIIEDYDTDRVEQIDDNDISVDETNDECYTLLPNFGMRSWTYGDSKDSMYANDVIENNTSSYDLSSFKYGLVLPRGDRDLADVLLHEQLKNREIKDMLLNVGTALKDLHNERVVHGNLAASNIIRCGSQVGLIDFDSSTLINGGNEDSSILSDKVGGVSQKICSGILPPELITRIDLSINEDDLRHYEYQWRQVSSDAMDYNLLNFDDISAVSSVLKSLKNETKSLNRGDEFMGSFAHKLRESIDETNNECWREDITDALNDISFEDLPDPLACCETLAEFEDVWNRLNMNAGLWERICPRYSADGNFAFIIKWYDDNNIRIDDFDLPYDMVLSDTKIDIWAFGILLFSFFSGTSLFHVGFDGHLHDAASYNELFNWDIETARYKIMSLIKDPLAQDLLLKLLVPSDQRLSSMTLVLGHPFFGPASSTEAQNILEEYEERQLSAIESKRLKEINKYITIQNKQSMEKHCKIIFGIMEDILFPTSFVVLPYLLEWNAYSNQLEPPRDPQSLSLSEKIGGQLIKINTATAKLSFWLRVKENLSQKGGIEFKSKVMTWIQRARDEGSSSIAKEIVEAIGCDDRYEGICREMLDEEMSVSNARAFIKDPMKAAAMLLEEAIKELMTSSSVQYLYLIDECRGVPILSDNETDIETDDTDKSYPIRILVERTHFEESLVPFLTMTMMVITSTYGLEGLARLVGLPLLSGIPKSWTDLNVGFISTKSSSASTTNSTLVQFATLQGILRQNQKEILLRKTKKYSLRLSESFGSQTDGNELHHLEAFFQEYDPHGYFAGLCRTCDDNDSSLTFWTKSMKLGNQTLQNAEFTQALKRLEQLQHEIDGKKKLEEEVKSLNERITELKKETETRLFRRSLNATSKKVDLNKIKPSFTETTFQTESSQTFSGHNIQQPNKEYSEYQNQFSLRPSTNTIEHSSFSRLNQTTQFDEQHERQSRLNYQQAKTPMSSPSGFNMKGAKSNKSVYFI